MHRLVLTALVLMATVLTVQAQTKPVFENGMAQVVDGFSNEGDWIREQLWV